MATLQDFWLAYMINIHEKSLPMVSTFKMESPKDWIRNRILYMINILLIRRDLIEHIIQEPKFCHNPVRDMAETHLGNEWKNQRVSKSSSLHQSDTPIREISRYHLPKPLHFEMEKNPQRNQSMQYTWLHTHIHKVLYCLTFEIGNEWMASQEKTRRIYYTK